jgi:hypothetical protein
VSANFQPVFAQLRDLLRAHAERFAITHDSASRYGLEAPVGPATVRSWGGKVKVQTIPVAWVSVGKAYVSYHLMGMPGNAKLLATLSDDLRAHMQGSSCFNFKTVNDALFQEIKHVTAESLRGMKKAGFISAVSGEPER